MAALRPPPFRCSLFIERAVGGAGTVVLAFFVHAKGIPGSGTVDVLLGNIVHTNGDAQHGAHGDEVSANVALGDSTVVSAPVHHDLVSGLEGGALLAVAAGSEPGAGPGGVGALHELVVDIFG